jgi:hypothetical protein
MKFHQRSFYMSSGDAVRALCTKLVSLIQADHKPSVKLLTLHKYLHSPAQRPLLKHPSILELGLKLLSRADSAINDPALPQSYLYSHSFLTQFASRIISHVLYEEPQLLFSGDLAKVMLAPRGPAFVPPSELILSCLYCAEKLGSTPVDGRSGEEIHQSVVTFLFANIEDLNRNLCLPDPPTFLPDSRDQHALLLLYSRYEFLAPVDPIFRTDLMVRWMRCSDVAYDEKFKSSIEFSPTADGGDEFAGALLSGTRRLSELILDMSTKGWKINEAEVSGVLESAFLLVCGAPVVSQINPPRSYISPSAHLGLIFEAVPDFAFKLVPEYLAQIAPKVTDDFLALSVKNFLEIFPMTEKQCGFLMKVLEGFCNTGRFQLMAMLTYSSCSSVLKNISKYPNVKAILSIYAKFLLGFQHSPLAFHELIPLICDTMTSLVQNADNTSFLALNELGVITSCLLFKSWL